MAQLVSQQVTQSWCWLVALSLEVWEENEAEVFIFLAISLLGCGLVVAVFLCGRAQLFSDSFC